MVPPSFGEVTMPLPAIEISLTVFRAGQRSVLTAETVRLLELVDQFGSITAAARELGKSYRWAWNSIAAAADFAQAPMLNTRIGGPAGGGSLLTEAARSTIRNYSAAAAQARETTVSRFADPS